MKSRLFPQLAATGDYRGIVTARIAPRVPRGDPNNMWKWKMHQAKTNTDARIDELEARLAQQEHSLLELSDELYQQQQQVAQLEVKVRHLADRLKLVEPRDTAGNSADEVPPHY